MIESDVERCELAHKFATCDSCSQLAEPTKRMLSDRRDYLQSPRSRSSALHLFAGFAAGADNLCCIL